jgi:hypothetical protein
VDNQQTNIAAGLAEEQPSELGAYQLKYPENYRRAQERRARAAVPSGTGESPVYMGANPEIVSAYPGLPGPGGGPGTGSGPTTYEEKNVIQTKFGPDAV